MPVCHFAAFLWHPVECSVCMAHYKVGWEQRDVDIQERMHAMDSLKKWVNGFRKGAKKGPFILEEIWRSRVLPDTDQRFVFDESMHGSGCTVEVLVDVHSAAATGDIQAPSTSGQGQIRTAAEQKMAQLEPMEEGEDVALQGGDDEGSQVSEGTENDLLRDPPVSTSEEPRAKDSGAAKSSSVADVASPPVCRGEAPRRATTTITTSNTRPVSSAVESGDTLPPRDDPPAPLFESPDQGGAPLRVPPVGLRYLPGSEDRCGFLACRSTSGLRCGGGRRPTPCLPTAVGLSSSDARQPLEDGVDVLDIGGWEFAVRWDF